MSGKPKTQRNATQAKNWAIEQLPGIKEEDLAKLRLGGITTTGKLLETARNTSSKEELANRLQVHPQYLNKWVALADLARVPGIGCQYCGLLLHAGIGSVKQLAQTPTHRLHQQILRLQVATMQRRDLCPDMARVAVWIQQARDLVIGC
jgi:predicted flap endonuclease-1-like 5' DNA nuclease